MAALNLKRGGRSFNNKKKRMEKGTCNSSGGGTQRSSHSNSGKSGRNGGHSYFICNRHWKFWEGAYRCDAPNCCGRETKAAVAATAMSSGSVRLCLLVDKATGNKFLADTEAAYSVVPYSSSQPTSGPAI